MTVEDPRELAGGGVAEEGPAPAGEHGRHPSPLISQEDVAHRVDARVKPVEVTPRDPAIDR
jgi:hypothetical protein